MADFFIQPAILLFGFSAGVWHAFESDHIAVMAAIVSSRKGLLSSSAAGILWGAGHTATLLLAGLAFLFLKLSIPTSFYSYMEVAVGAMLVILGISAIRNASLKEHEHYHAHGKMLHSHCHGHGKGHVHSHRPFFVGMVHGLAGSGAILLASMGIRLPFAFAARKSPSLNKWMGTGAGLLSIAVGLFLIAAI